MRSPLPALALAVCGAVVAAQDAPAKAPTPAPFTIPPGDLRLDQLLDLAARHLQANFIAADPRLLADARPFTLTQPVTTDRAGCVRAVQAILSTRGIDVVPLDARHGIYELAYGMSERGVALQAVPPFVPLATIVAEPHGHDHVVTAVPLQHVSAAAATSALRPFFASSAGLAGIAGQQLLVAGKRHQVARAARIVEANDVPTFDAATRQQLEAQVHQLEQKVGALKASVEALPKEEPREEQPKEEQPDEEPAKEAPPPGAQPKQAQQPEGEAPKEAK